MPILAKGWQATMRPYVIFQLLLRPSCRGQSSAHTGRRKSFLTTVHRCILGLHFHSRFADKKLMRHYTAQEAYFKTVLARHGGTCAFARNVQDLNSNRYGIHGGIEIINCR